MVYASSETLHWHVIVRSWLKQLPEEPLTQKLKDQLWTLFETHIENTFEFMESKNFREPIPTVKLNSVISMCRLLEAIVDHTVDLHQFEGDRLKNAVNKVFIYALAWAFGGSIDSAHYSSFEVYMGTAFAISDLPKTSIFDNQFIPAERLEYTPWTTNMPKFEYSKDKSFFELVVPTKDTVRFSWLLKLNILKGFPIFLTGMTGVGKSIITQSVITELKGSSKPYEAIQISFSSQTSSKETQNLIEEKLEKRRKNLLAGPNGKKVILFIDDVNMPAYDTYGTQSPIELLR